MEHKGQSECSGLRRNTSSPDMNISIMLSIKLYCMANDNALKTEAIFIGRKLYHAENEQFRVKIQLAQ